MSAIKRIFDRLIPRSVGMLGAMLIFLSTGAIQSLVVFPYLYSLQHAEFNEIRDLAVRYWMATIDARTQNRAEENERVGKRLVIINAIVGGAIYDGSGALLSTFGEQPQATLEAMQQERINQLSSDAGTRTDYFIAPSQTQTPFQIIVRADTSRVALDFQRNVDLAIIVIAAGALIAAATSLFFVRLRVGRLAKKIAHALEKAIEHPSRSASFVTSMKGRDEIAALAHTVDVFLTQISNIWVRRVEVADRMLQELPFGTILLRANGEIVQCNPTVEPLITDVFRRDDGISGERKCIRDIATDRIATLREFTLATTDRLTYIEILGTETPSYFVATSVRLSNDSKEQLYAVMLADIGSVQSERLTAEYLAAQRMAYIEMMRRREAEMKMMLDSCMSLIQAGTKIVETGVEPITPALDWCQEMAQAGILATYDLPDSAPTVSGSPAAVSSIFRNALMLGYASCGRWPISVDIKAQGINFETVGFTITVTAAEGSQEISDSGMMLDKNVAMAALRSDIRRCRGQLAEITSENGTTRIQFILRGVSEWLQASQQSPARG